MLFTTTTQYVALAVALVAGWLLGLASHPGGARWKRRYAEEREAHAIARREHDARVAEANARAVELERENVRLARAAPVTAATIAPGASTRADTLATPTYPASNGPGWFNWRNRVTTTR
jgi:hypothetical protein